jgi:hypothetical protein
MNILCFDASETSNTQQDRRYPWQKVSGNHPVSPPFFFFFFLCERKLSSFLREPTSILWTLGFVSHQCWDYCDAWYLNSLVLWSEWDCNSGHEHHLPNPRKSLDGFRAYWRNLYLHNIPVPPGWCLVAVSCWLWAAAERTSLSSWRNQDARFAEESTVAQL